MTRTFKGLFLGSCMVLVAGCAIGQSESFTFTADLPPNFAYYAIAKYAPAEGETCTVTLDDNPYLGFNREWRTEYKPEHEVPIYRTVKGCRLAIYKIDLEINATYGKDRGDFSGDTTAVIIRKELEEKYKGTFYTAEESAINGQCQWLFRTVGPKRYIRKLLDCKKVDAQGMVAKGRPVGAYTLDQLPGKTVKLKIKLADEEAPGWGDTWVKVPNGWKRCLGKGLEDQHGYCHGNYKDFSTFKMPDDRTCTIYPGCTE
ncbi:MULTISPECIES: hypothetical protein [Pseudomonas]|uniref:hypothetical protein n=1 Tax=Pseudomonas TaxID=286 RepID=UPI00087BE883|nr:MULTISPECIES: hypothetical protein [Pseudomonas]AZD86192.1 lipoprotein [Pseudomonas chlororaphis subsp. aureofaciens]AZD92705.1 lipoprotein [Pseudomonas chlororaphis subsp. aureofaciens]AZD99150.1 lipoprotein [Pseudomonas chlororaphis subsp. aureofaciens]AZE05334.1 lipoprotein [Pseudomonas chlororaphis subsp. aureofaciens]KAA5842955.1 hypothetical protein F2A37_14810 [Pseudomonas chlororaphis]